MFFIYKNYWLFVFIGITCTLYTNCQKQELISETTSRSFRMGVTPWPADFNESELNKAYLFIKNDCDIVSHHFDEGIPYEEAYSGAAWPEKLLEEIKTRKSKTAAGKKVFLSSAPLNLTRAKKADYSRFSESILDSIKTAWDKLAFNDPKVAKAYINYLHFLIKEFNPIYINYGVESNVETWSAAEFQNYLDFVKKVYSELKSTYPSVPIFLSLMTNESKNSLRFASLLMPYSDMLALSSYPYTHVSSSAIGNTNPDLFPDSYFGKYLDLDTKKPFGFAETAYIAEDLIVPSFTLNKKGTESWQKKYLDQIIDITNKRNGKFIIWFCHKDYNAGVQTLKRFGLYQDLFALWQDTGLKDENDGNRLAYDSWKAWYGKELSE